MRQLFTILLFVFGLAIKPYAQDGSISELKRVFLNKRANDTDRVEANILLASIYQTKNLDSAIYFLRQSAGFAKNKRMLFHEGLCYSILGEYHDNVNKRLVAIDYFLRAIELFTSDTDSILMSFEAQVHNNLAVSYEKIGEKALSIENYFASYNIATRLKDSVAMARCYLNIGSLTASIGEYLEAESYYKRALDIATRTENKDLLSKCYVNLGKLEFEMNLILGSLEYYYLAIKSREETDQSVELIAAMGGLSSIYTNELTIRKSNKPGLELFKDLEYGQILDSALKFSSGCLNIAMNLRMHEWVSKAYIDISNIYGMDGNFIMKFEFCDMARLYADSIHVAQAYADACDCLHKAYEQSMEFDSALKYAELAELYEDSLFNLENIKKVAKANVHFEYELRQFDTDNRHSNENRKHELEMARRSFMLYGTLAGLLLIAIALYWIYQRFKLEKKQARIINKQLAEIKSSNAEIDVKNKAVLSSMQYAERIQKATNPNVIDMQRIFKDHFVYFKPRELVGGDSYWVYKSTNKVVIAALDCSGQGVPGAFLSLIGRDLLSKIVVDQGKTTCMGIVNALHTEINLMLENENVDLGLKISLAVIDVKSNEAKVLSTNGALFVSDASGIIRYDNVVQEISAKNVGFLSELKEDTIDLNRAEFLILVTDGFNTLLASKNRSRADSMFENALIAGVQQDNVEEKINKCMEGLIAESAQEDDICVVGVKLR